MAGFCDDPTTAVTTYLDSHIAKADSYANSAVNALWGILPRVGTNTPNQGDLTSSLKANPSITGTSIGSISDGNIAIAPPTAPALTPIAKFSLGTAPTFNERKPSAGMPSKPNVSSIPKPSSGIIDTTLNLPSAPTLDFGSPPKLTPIKIPTIIALDIKDFTGIAPTGKSIKQPDASFSYIDNGTYTSDIESQVEARMTQMADNDWGIPDYIWDLAWEQGRERERNETEQIIDTINTDMAGRGFMLPQGVQLARIDQANQKNLAATITINRQQVMEQEKEKTNNFRFHVQQGIAFEQVRGQWYNTTQDRILDAAKFTFTASVQLFQAHVEFFNSQVLIFKTESDVYKIEVEAEVARLEAQKIEIEAQALVSDINKDAVAIYVSEVEALNTKADVYKTQVDAAVAKLESAKIGVSLYTQEINSYAQQINQNDSEYRNYKTEVDAKGIEYQNYATAAQAFSSEVQAYKVNADAQAVSNQSISEHNKSIVAQYDASIKGINLQLQSQVAGLQASIGVHDVRVKQFLAEAGASKSNVEAVIQSQQNQVAYANQRTQANIQWSRSTSAASLANANAAVERMNSIGTIYAGLASASVSAANISYGQGFTTGNSCSTTYSVPS